MHPQHIKMPSQDVPPHCQESIQDSAKSVRIVPAADVEAKSARWNSNSQQKLQATHVLQLVSHHNFPDFQPLYIVKSRMTIIDHPSIGKGDPSFW